MKNNLLRLIVLYSKQTLKYFLFQLLVIQVIMAEPGSGQSMEDYQVQIQAHNQKLVTVLAELEQQTDFIFAYNQEVAKDKTRISLNLSTDLKSMLKKITEQVDYDFKRVNEQIYVVKSEVLYREHGIDESGEEAELWADVEISGTVTDERGAPIPGATVIIDGTSTGTVTDIDGNFSIDADEGDVIRISFIGYQTQSVSIGNQTNLQIVLTEDQSSLEEVLVVGYGTQKKEDVTGAVSSVNQEAIKNLPVSTLDQKMVGQVAGVQIQQVSGAPGAGTSVKIRGSGSLGAGNEPLYVIDGMPYSSGMNQTLNPLMFIDPNNIESITILKDASSTAIYGSRGANGVIMITTKKGEYEQTNVNFSSMVGVQQVPQKGRPNLLNQREFAQFQRDRIDIGVRQTENREPNLNDYPEEYRNLDALSGPGTDWYDLVLQSASIQDHNFSLQKGTKDSRINFSLGYFKQEGVLKHTGIERFSSNLGIETNVSDKIKLGASIQPTFIKQDRANTNLNRGDVLGVSIWANPISTPYDENGNLKPYIVAPQSRFHSAWSFANPLFVLQESHRQQNTFQNLGIAYAEVEILPNLRFRSSLNTIFEVSKFEQFIPSTVGDSNRPPTPGTGFSSNSRSNSFDWLIENTVNYDLTKGDHRINALLGYTTQKFTSNSISLAADPFPNDLIRTINAAQAIESWGEVVNEWSMISYLGRINYAWKDKYLLTTTFRSDGSSRFGRENRYALFPSLAAAWRISRESFFSDINWIDELKLRASYGKSGNNNIGNYAHLATISAGSYVFDDNQVTASSVGLSNPFLTWEESNQFDLGLDFLFLDSRLSLLVDLYRRESNNMLLNDVIPAITGFNSQTINQGNVRNTGLEIALGGTPYEGEFTWNINANIAFNRNEVIALNDNTVRILAGNNDGNPTHISVVGKPIGQFYGFVLEGVYTPEDLENPAIIKTPQVYEGNVKYRDVNGDSLINDVLDYTIIGNPHPDFIFGLTNNFAYKGIDLGIIINGQQGGQVMNGLRQTTDNLQGFFNVDRDWENRWRSREDPGDGIHSGIPQVRPSWGHRVSTLWVEDASYLRISNLTLGYTFSGKLMERLRILKGSRIYMTVQNLAMFTNYKGANPEGQAANQNNTLVPGFDMTSYPLSRTTSLGINLSF
ncbi:TonB-linked outer membrane protein, SusC/RagA family [Cyclobacterium lianum]|uniref:TonB-linked outer membrane protein, SusC/RagA family n=1 Tax=Cyclobacterium lianum TaxID=388280 RepID=A0A1M7LFA7_9BACT|nr:TonB-dependent receptor [Cyclobacterium lianum]SHM76754.1 TonB-linked outer membrane protein, SusC/RagA family [Cyclobacterium lianum]